MSDLFCSCTNPYTDHDHSCSLAQQFPDEGYDDQDDHQLQDRSNTSTDGSAYIDNRMNDIPVDPEIQQDPQFQHVATNEDLPYSSNNRDKTVEVYNENVNFLFTRDRTVDADIPAPPTHLPTFQPDNNVYHVDCENFVDRPAIVPTIRLSGRLDVCFDLRQLIDKSYLRQYTDSDELLCGIYALQISMSARLREHRMRAPTFAELKRILQGVEFKAFCEQSAIQIADPITGQLVTAELNQPNYLSVDQLAIILHLWGRRKGRALQLGVCTMARTPPDSAVDIPSNQYNVYTVNCNLDAADALIIWIVNDNMGRKDEYDDVTLNHWSGVAPDASMPPPGRKKAVASKTTKTGDTPKPAKKKHLRKVAKDPIPEELTIGFYCTFPKCRRQKPFKMERDLKRHKNTVHIPKSARKHGCPYAKIDGCEERFHWPKDVGRHIMDIHLKSHPLRCLVDTCTKNGHQMRNCERHYETMHPGVPVPTPEEVLRMVQKQQFE